MTSTPPRSPSPSGASSVQVVVRLRPMNEMENKHGTTPVVAGSTKDKSVTVIKGQGVRQVRSNFVFDNVFTAFSTQEEVFDATLKPVITDVMHGYESTVFAYGQTGTGKTHTMEGELSIPELHGIIPRSAMAIFDALDKPEYTSNTITCSYLEIYNEDLFDLLDDETHRLGEKKPKLEIMEGKNGTFCRGLSEKTVKSAADVLELMQKAQHQRKIGETKLNKHSSRSHCIFSLRVNAKKTLSDGNILEFSGKLHMVDLAGSECAKAASLGKGSGTEIARERERMNINRSLLTLGRVISLVKEQSQSKKAQKMRIPYRDSKLTRILQESLGGRCKTLIVATLSPSITALEESISTLNYAQAASGIVNKPVAASYLSITPTKGMTPSSSSVDSGNSENITLEHWHEMECKLLYMQSQVEEAQGALARKHLIQQEAVDRAEKAESTVVELEEKNKKAMDEIASLKGHLEKTEREKKEVEKQYYEATQKINSLEGSLAKVKKEKEDVELKLRQTEITLKKTNAILSATQKTEIKLTNEASLLIDALKNSISDGDGLHQCLLEARDAQVQVRQSTREFHSSTLAVLKSIVSRLDQLSEAEKSHHERLLDSTQKGFDKDEKSLTRSSLLVKEIADCVSKLTCKMKMHSMGENGIVPTMSSMTEKSQDGLMQSKRIIEGGEESLSQSCREIHKELDGYSQHLQSLDSTYASDSERLVSGLESNISEMKSNLLTMVSMLSESMSKIRSSNLETRNALEELISQWKESVLSSSREMERSTNEQTKIVRQRLEAFDEGMQHHDRMDEELSKQRSFLSMKGGEHLTDVLSQKEMLSSQKEAFAAAQKVQQELQENFLKTVMEGMQQLMEGQMERIAKEGRDQFRSFEVRNENLSELNGKMRSSAETIFDEVRETNGSLVDHVEMNRKNDSMMKSTAEETESLLIRLERTCQDQQGVVREHAEQSLGRMEELSQQDLSLEKTVKKNTVDGEDCARQFEENLERTRSGILELTKAGKNMCRYATDTAIPKTSLALDEMEKPRPAMMGDFVSSIDTVSDILQSGKSAIEVLAKEQGLVADELCTSVESNATDYRENYTKIRREEILERRDSTIAQSEERTDESRSAISLTLTDASTVRTGVGDFATKAIKAEEEVPPAPKRKGIEYSEKLSSTPSDDVIFRGLDFGIVVSTQQNGHYPTRSPAITVAP